MESRSYSTLQQRIGYKFNDLEILKNALTHSSYANEAGLPFNKNNERLEFIGDAYLDAFIGIALFELMPKVKEGVLSKRRADIVCERSLSQVAKEIGLGEFILLGKGEDQGGGRNKSSILADTVEAIIGAIVIDGGVSEAERVVLDLFKQYILLSVQGRLNQDYKSMLQEILQERYKNIRIEYKEISEKGPDHAKEFVVALIANDKELGRGKGSSKKEAEQNAAGNVIKSINHKNV